MLDLFRRFDRRPRFCVWELTLTCNLRCLHCGSHAGAPRADELDRAALLDIADQLADLGCEKVTLSGGEPTLHPHWAEIGQRLGQRGVRVNLLSNGWSWSDAEVEAARRAGLCDVGFSLDGLAASHDAVRREGSFDRVVAALRSCAAAGLPATVVSHVNQLNKHQLLAFRDFLAELGAAVWQVQLGNPSGNMRDHRDLVIPPEDLLWLIPLLAELRQRTDRPELQVAENIGYYGRYEPIIRGNPDPRIPVWIGCGAGWLSIGIESSGDVKGCLSLPSSRHDGEGFVEGNLRRASLAEIWNRPGGFRFNRELRDTQFGGFCAHCRYRDICRAGCSWTAYSHTGNRHDNPYCFYRQAVAARRFDLLDEPPTAVELAAIDSPGD